MFKLFFDSSSSVEHYLDDAVDMPVGRREGPRYQAPSGVLARAHLIDVEDLPLDLTRFQDILGQRAQYGFLAEPEAEGLHPADETALAVTH